MVGFKRVALLAWLSIKLLTQHYSSRISETSFSALTFWYNISDSKHQHKHKYFLLV